MMKYALHAINLEAFSTDNVIDEDVVLDGYNSV